MASLNQVSIELKVSGEREAERALKNLDRAQKSLDRGIRASVDSSNKNAKSLDRISREAAKAQREMDRLAKAVQQGTLNQSQFHAESNRIAARLRRLGMDKAQSEVIRYKNALLQANEASKLVSSSTAQVATATNQFGGSTQFASRKLNAMGVVTQQTGYQVGDFLVQIQGGTNIFVALGQQLTQLIGTFGIFAKSLRAITIISGLGILVPILTAIGAAFMRTREAAEDTEDEIQTLSDTISRLNTIQRTVAVDFERGLNAAFAESANSVSKLLDQLREAEFRSAMQPLKDSFDEITVGVDRLDAALNMMVGFDNAINSGQELSVAQQQLLDRSRNLVEENLSLAISYDNVRASLDAITESKSTQELITNFAKALEIAEALPGPIAGELVDALLEAAREAGLLEQIISQAEGATNDTANATDGITSGLSRAVNEAVLLRDTLASVGRAALSRQDQIAVLNAQIRAARAGASVPAAEAQTETALEMARGGATADQIAAAALAAGQQEATIEALEAELSGLLRPPSGGESGTSGAGATGYAGLFPELAAAYEQAEKLAKAYAEEVEILDFALEEGLITQEKYNQEIARAQEAYNQSAEAANQYEDIILRMANTTSDAIGQAMMDIVTGTKSASEAFSDMARIILKKAFELLVINPIINSIFGGSGLDISGFNPLPSILDENANGGVFQGGAKVQAFATGGVVGSPTFFPMANGNVGLMGEAGPEAIMPLKRGKGGRLGVEVSGEQGNVVINQTFAFQANGDDSVKRIIASEAPKIAALTQKQMLDARRRGGVVRDTFA